MKALKVLFCFFLLLPISLWAQNHYIKGRITECESNEPLAFAVVVAVEAPTVGVVVDENGEYKLTVADSVKNIEVRYIGYNKKVIRLPEHKTELMVIDVCLSYQMDIYPPPPPIPPVIVEGFRNDAPPETIPAAISRINRSDIEASDQTSLQNSLNMIPGVIMEQRGYGGSHRINIRGSAFRAPFAVRNVKMYMDGIPLTSPDGQAPLEMVDASEIESVEVIKGPAGSVWGSGNGGVIHFKGKNVQPYLSNVSSSFQVGSYDLYRMVNRVELGRKNGGISLTHIFQDNEGYRVQEYNHKNQISLHGKYSTARSTFILYGNYFNGRWALPGGLNALQADTLPTQASNYSWMNNANVWRERIMIGGSHNYKFNNRSSLRTSVYGYRTNKKNPFGTSPASNGYKVEAADGAGTRVDWSKLINLDSKTGENQMAVRLGGEYQFEIYHITESTLFNGQPGAFRYLYDIDYHTAMVFASTDFNFHDTFFINAGISANQNIQRAGGNTSSDFTYDTTIVNKTALLPRIALDWRFFKQSYFYVSATKGNSNPTVFEMVDYENNSYNLNLKPENGLSLEAGLKSAWPEKFIYAEINAYRFALSDAIVSYHDTTGISNEVYRYTNAGSAIQQGIEWNASKNFYFDYKEIEKVFFLRLMHSGSIYHYKFEDFRVADSQFDDVQFAGKNIPGVPLMNLSNMVQFIIKGKYELDVQHYWFDKAPLNNQNTTWSGAYHLLNVKVKATIFLKEKIAMDVFAGVNNLTNTKYSSYFNLNNEFNRFYNPSPPANYFGGLSFKWQIANRIPLPVD